MSLTDTKWFTVPFRGAQTADFHARLSLLGFFAEGELYRDRVGRTIIFEETHVRIGIPKTDVVDEQEQLEFVAAGMGLDVEEARKI